MSKVFSTLVVAIVAAVPAHDSSDDGLVLLQQYANVRHYDRDDDDVVVDADDILYTPPKQKTALLSKRVNNNQIALPKPWESTSKKTHLRTGGDPEFAKIDPIPRKWRNTTGCASELNDPEAYWSGVAGEYGNEDFAPHHKNLTSRHGKKLNDLFCASVHTTGAHRRVCTRYPTEKERYDAIRRALKNTAKLFNDMELPYYLDSGSLIGEWRCGEVLPWSEDADIHVPAAAMEQLFMKVFGKPQKAIKESAMDTFMVTHETNPLVPEDLVIWAWGWENSLGKAQPIGIADRSTGFYVDVWTEEKGDTDENGTEWLERYWQHAPSKCSKRKGYTTEQCFKYPAKMVHPTRECQVDGVDHRCPADSRNYLYIEYGIGFKHAPVQYREAFLEEGAKILLKSASNETSYL